MFRQRLIADGGNFRIKLKVDPDDAEKLGQLRIICGGTTRLIPVTHISLFSKLPVQQRAVYEDRLLQLSRRPAFTININYPFKNKLQETKSTNFHLNFDISSPQLKKLGKDLLLAVKDLPRFEIIGSRHAWNRSQVLAPRFMLGSKISSIDDLNRKLEFAKQNYKRGVRTVTAVGLSLEFQPVFEFDPETGQKIIINKRTAKDFLFDGVDEHVHEYVEEEKKGVSGIDGSSTGKVKVPKI